MKKMAIAFGTSVFVAVVTAIPAWADSSLPRPPHVLGAGGSRGAGGAAGTAFTGASNLSPVMLAFVLLLVVGVSVLALQRRRSAAS